MEQPVPVPRVRSRTKIPVPTARNDSGNDQAKVTATVLHVAEVHNEKRNTKYDSTSGAEEANENIGSEKKTKKKVKRKSTFLVRHKAAEETMDKENFITCEDKLGMPSDRKSSTTLNSSKASSIESLKLPTETTTASETPKPTSRISNFNLDRKSNTNSIESIQDVGEFKMPGPPPLRRGSATETLSESSNDGSKNNKIKLKPLTHHTRRKKPSGYATETLSEDSSHHNSPTRVSSAPLPRPRKKWSIPGPSVSADIISSDLISAARTQNNRSISNLNIPSAPVISPPSSPNKIVKLDSAPSTHSSPKLTEKIVEKATESPIQKFPASRRPSITDSAQLVPDSPISYYTSSSVDYRDTGVIPQPRMKRSKKKRKLKDNPGASTEDSEGEVSSAANEVEGNQADELVDKDTAVCITVHRCEPLRIKDLHKHPFVRMYLMDLKTKTLRRSAFGKNPVDIVQTQPFDHIQSRSVSPTWEEDLILMEPASHVVSGDCVMIFELLEEETADVVAWCFLKPLAANGKQNVGSVLRLQLFKPVKTRTSKSDDASLSMAFSWYIKNKMSSYRSTMLVSVHSIDSKLVVRPSSPNFTAPNPNQPAKTHIRRRSSQMSSSGAVQLSEAEKELMGVVWSRLPSLSCKLPNKMGSSLPAGPDGGMSVSYSKSGLLIACHTSTTISIFTYKGSRYLTLNGHHGLVYDLNWSPDDSFLLSASADTTACVWNIKLKQTTPVAVLSHPSYVYCGIWIGPSLAITGCYDRALRLWDLVSVPTLVPQNSSVASGINELHKTATYEPIQCVSVHKARINTLAILSSDEILVSGDSDGVLVFWKLSTTLPRQLELSREVKLRELKGQVINKVSAHPGGKRILVSTRDSKLRMVDLQSASIIQWYHGGVNSKLQTGSCFCGCGSRVLSCSEDGSVSVWDANLGERIAVYKGLFLPNSPATVAFHPKDNMFAIVSHKTGVFPALVLSTFSREVTANDVTIEWLDNRTEKLGSGSSVSDLSVRSSRESIVEQISSKKKKRGILKTLLQGSTKAKDKRGISNNGYTDTESGEGTSSELNHFSRKKRAAHKLLETLDSDGEINHRLTDIIKRMDDLIMTGSSHQQVY